MSLICAEYRCPDHGIFEEIVDRPAPDEMFCHELLEDGARCCRPSSWTISAPRPKVLSVPCYATVRGGDTERRPGMLDTRPLADGQSYTAWSADQAKTQRDRRHKQLIDKGLTSKKVIVGGG